MKILSKIKSFFTRNLAFSNHFAVKTGAPVYNNWTVRKAVKDGYKANSWVYRAVTLITKSAASVEWGVVNDEGELTDHYLAGVLERPNKSISRQDLFELLISWLELTGNAYLKAVKVGRQTTEIWPVSPDRLRPVLTKDVSEWIAGYALDEETSVKFEPDEIIHFMYFDPANPYIGIGPLQAVAKTVDIDVEQLNWNKSAMQNRGVLDGVFSFKREFQSQSQSDAVADSLNEKYAGSGNARKLGVVGSEAKYIRTALTPVQMDFLESRKFNRDEIFIIFGVPPQYAGTQESSTYNNYQTSELIFWFQKIIPLLNDLKDTLNFFFYDELGGNKISYNLNKVPAIRRAMMERSKTAKTLFEMGVPFSQLNQVFEFGIEEYEGWDISHVSNAAVKEALEIKAADEGFLTRDMPQLLQTRDLDKEADAREDYAIKKSKDIEILLGDQQEIIFDALEKNAKAGDLVSKIDPEKLIATTSDDWIELYTELTSTYAYKAAGQVVIEKRAVADETKVLIDKYFEDEATVLTELSLLDETTVTKLIAQMEEGIDAGWTVSQLQQAIVDTGIFEAPRALMLSRTITGTAASIGQYVSAKETGATHKRWVNSGFEVRDLHIERAAEKAVKINERFSAKDGATLGPMYPLDLVLTPGDRVNCFLPSTRIEGEFIKAMQSTYHGKAVEIITSHGNILRVTRKHPVFTEKGFVPADSVEQGDNLVARKGNVKGPAQGRNVSFAATSFPSDKDNDPPKIEQIFSAFSAIGFNEFRRGSAGDFHGDGQFVKGYIEIVGANRPLLVNDKISIPEKCGEFSFKCKDFILNLECGFSSGGSSDNIIDISSSCGPSSGALTLDQILVFLHYFPFEGFRFGLSPKLDVTLAKGSINGSSGNVEHFGNSIDAFAAFVKGDNPFGIVINSFVPSFIVGGASFDFSPIDNFVKRIVGDSTFVDNFRNGKSRQIQFDNVISINHFDYSGFVYDVETPYGWLIAENLIVSNCRCSTIFEINQ